MASINDTQLEKTFADLAYNHLRDKANQLNDYLLGFQMLKQEDDGKRAVGIFGFEIDGSLYLAPIFFLNGEIKGLDSIYSEKSDLFVPLTEDWVNTIINRNTPQVGEPDTRDRMERGAAIPNYTKLKVIPGGTGDLSLKLAGARSYGYDHVSATEALTEHGCAGIFKQAMETHPGLYDAFTSFYDVADLVDAPEPKYAAEEQPVIIVTSVTDEGVDELTDEQRKTILEGGVAVVDKRPEVAKSILYSTEARQKLENPTGGGLYDVIWSDGSVCDALITPTSDPAGTVFVYCLSDKRHCIIAPQSVWVLRKYSDAEFQDWLEKNAKRPSELSNGDTAVFVFKNGAGTAGFCLKNKTTGLDGNTLYDVNDKYWMDAEAGRCWGGIVAPGQNFGYAPTERPMPVNYGHTYMAGRQSSTKSDPNARVEAVLVTSVKVTKPTYTIDKLVVSDHSAYAIVVNHFKLESVDDTYQKETYDKPKFGAVLKRSDFGDTNTVIQALQKTASEMVVWTTGGYVNIRDDAGTHTFNKLAAFEHLIRRTGLGESDARIVLDDADCFAQTHYVKKAESFLDLPQEQDLSQGGFMSMNHEQRVPWRGVSKKTPENNRDYYRYQSPFGPGGAEGESSVDVVANAGKTGQKEVFDAAVLSSLIKSHAPTDMVDRFLPTITAGMDRLGRILFLTYWHYEQFEERYGENDMVEFLDNLKSTFNSLGDVVIFAKRKTLAGDPEHYGLGLNADPASDEAEA